MLKGKYALSVFLLPVFKDTRRFICRTGVTTITTLREKIKAKEIPAELKIANLVKIRNLFFRIF